MGTLKTIAAIVAVYFIIVFMGGEKTDKSNPMDFNKSQLDPTVRSSRESGNVRKAMDFTHANGISKLCDSVFSFEQNDWTSLRATPFRYLGKVVRIKGIVGEIEKYDSVWNAVQLWSIGNIMKNNKINSFSFIYQPEYSDIVHKGDAVEFVGIFSGVSTPDSSYSEETGKMSYQKLYYVVGGSMKKLN